MEARALNSYGSAQWKWRSSCPCIWAGCNGVVRITQQHLAQIFKCCNCYAKLPCVRAEICVWMWNLESLPVCPLLFLGAQHITPDYTKTAFTDVLSSWPAKSWGMKKTPALQFAFLWWMFYFNFLFIFPPKKCIKLASNSSYSWTDQGNRIWCWVLLGSGRDFSFLYL